MGVKFKREGGFAGITLKREAEVEDLPQEAGEALHVLRRMKPEGARRSSYRRDTFLYTIEFERDGQPVVIALDEEQVPEDVVPLIRYFESSS